MQNLRIRMLPALLPLGIEMAVTETHIVWRRSGEPWQDLISLAELIDTSGVIQSISVGTGLAIDNTDPAHPVISLAE